jgi:hypothetical protein
MKVIKDVMDWVSTANSSLKLPSRLQGNGVSPSGLDAIDDKLTSILANHPFPMNLDKVIPYYEVKIKAMSGKNSVVAVGFSDDLLPRDNLPGWFQNSYGWHSDDGGLFNPDAFGKESMDWGKGTFGVGDTIGCGVMNDSFNARLIFYTRNGNFVGFTPFRAHTGANLYPAVGIEGASISVNFGATPFEWDPTSAISQSRRPQGITSDGRSTMDDVPHEILRIILFDTVEEPHDLTLRLSFVSKRFNEIANDNEIWKKMFLKTWADQNPNLKLKSWKNLYKARKELMKKSESAIHPIENCSFEFKCPIALENIEAAGDGVCFDYGQLPSTIHCSNCNQDVYTVTHKSQMDQYVSLGRCVSIYVERRNYHMRGRMVSRRK